MTTEQRFWAKVKKTDSCWIWTASKRAKGYGAFCHSVNGVQIQDRAHRYSWLIHKGAIPEGLWVLHNCPGGDNPACVNPAHLFLGNVNDNNQDMKLKGRHVAGGTHCGRDGKWPRGLNHHGVKINEEIVREIRALKSTHSYSQLSKRFGLALGHLNRIVSGKAWGHVK
jgi:HNH endonuclease